MLLRERDEHQRYAGHERPNREQCASLAPRELGEAPHGHREDQQHDRATQHPAQPHLRRGERLQRHLDKEKTRAPDRGYSQKVGQPRPQGYVAQAVQAVTETRASAPGCAT